MFFSGVDGNGEPVLFERDWTDGVGVVGAIRIGGFVEVERGSAVLGCFGLDEAAAAVGFSARSLILKQDEKAFPTRGGEGLQVKALAGELEDKIASDHVGFLASVSERYQDGLLLRGGGKLRGDAVGEVDGKPGRTGKGLKEWALGIAQEQREFIAERADAKLEIAETDAIGRHWRLGYLQSDGSRDWFVIERNGSAGNRLKREPGAATDERADVLGSFGGQNDRRGGIATECGGAFVDAESADQQERASRRAQELVGISSVFFDLGTVGVIGCENSGGRQKQQEGGALGTNHATFEPRQR